MVSPTILPELGSTQRIGFHCRPHRSHSAGKPTMPSDQTTEAEAAIVTVFSWVNDIDRPLTQFERGVIDRTVGRPCDPSLLDECEEAEYRRGYNHDFNT